MIGCMGSPILMQPLLAEKIGLTNKKKRPNLPTIQEEWPPEEDDNQILPWCRCCCQRRAPVTKADQKPTSVGHQQQSPTMTKPATLHHDTGTSDTTVSYSGNSTTMNVNIYSSDGVASSVWDWFTKIAFLTWLLRATVWSCFGEGPLPNFLQMLFKSFMNLLSFGDEHDDDLESGNNWDGSQPNDDFDDSFSADSSGYDDMMFHNIIVVIIMFSQFVCSSWGGNADMTKNL